MKRTCSDLSHKLDRPFIRQAREECQSQSRQLHTSWVSQGVGAYHSLVVDVRRSFASGFQFRGNYTYSKNLDDGSAWNTSVSGNTPAFVEFPLDPKLDWGPSATDVRHAASFNGSYELPFGPHRRFLSHASAPVNFIASGWTASAIVAVQTGFPFTPQLGYNPTGNGDTRNPVRPNWNPNFSGTLYPRRPQQYFNAAAFLPPATGTYGNVSRDALTGPGLSEIDFSATRNAHLTERLGLQFRAGSSSTSSTTPTCLHPMKWSTPRPHRASRPRRAWSRPHLPPRARFNSEPSCSSDSIAESASAQKNSDAIAHRWFFYSLLAVVPLFPALLARLACGLELIAGLPLHRL